MTTKQQDVELLAVRRVTQFGIPPRRFTLVAKVSAWIRVHGDISPTVLELIAGQPRSRPWTQPKWG